MSRAIGACSPPPHAVTSVNGSRGVRSTKNPDGAAARSDRGRGRLIAPRFPGAARGGDEQHLVPDGFGRGARGLHGERDARGALEQPGAVRHPGCSRRPPDPEPCRVSQGRLRGHLVHPVEQVRQAGRAVAQPGVHDAGLRGGPGGGAHREIGRGGRPGWLADVPRREQQRGGHAGIAVAPRGPGRSRLDAVGHEVRDGRPGRRVHQVCQQPVHASVEQRTDGRLGQPEPVHPREERDDAGDAVRHAQVYPGGLVPLPSRAAPRRRGPPVDAVRSCRARRASCSTTPRRHGAAPGRGQRASA